jgi:hypothetical protein
MYRLFVWKTRIKKKAVLEIASRTAEIPGNDFPNGINNGF